MKKLVFVPFVNGENAGKLIIPAKNDNQVLCRAESLGYSVEGNRVYETKRSCIVSLPKALASVIVADGNVNDVFTKVLGQPEQHIIKVRTPEAQYEGQPKAINPTTGEELNYYVSFTLAPVGTADIDETKAVEITTTTEEPVAQTDFMEA